MCGGAEDIKASRNAALKELYEQEALAYAAELNSMGLALAKDRV